VDRKLQDHGMFMEKYSSIFGCDIASVDAEVGTEVRRYAVGDRAIG